ncbi:hypothetical protein LA02_1522 [Francisella philomiragia]|uniref:hypothetical protein n=1 Tax=Francisella philomiragia TaxID=28110 RepID=UPI0005A5721E|nr:hypothetical protein [Francisella philomiragia]AJI56851.1 hypothetical protein LA02_1522 [Francisella philomiragia]
MNKPEPLSVSKVQDSNYDDYIESFFAEGKTITYTANFTTKKLQKGLVDGVLQYIYLHNYKINPNAFSKAGYHSSNGLKRALELLRVAANVKESVDIEKAMIDCFKKNKIGDFKGGFFSQIRSNPTSLFTCVCRTLIPNLAIVKIDDMNNFVKLKRLKDNSKFLNINSITNDSSKLLSIFVS